VSFLLGSIGGLILLLIAIPHPASASHVSLDRTSVAPIATDSGATMDGDQGHDNSDGRSGTLEDLHGNDVTDAVARYKLDAAGSLYEVHSPQTELPRLRAPGT
jgi:hypothetical protein